MERDMDGETERNGVAEKVMEEGKGKGSDEVLPEKKSKFPNRQIRKMPLLLATLYYDTEQVTPHLAACMAAESSAAHRC